MKWLWGTTAAVLIVLLFCLSGVSISSTADTSPVDVSAGGHRISNQHAPANPDGHDPHSSTASTDTAHPPSDAHDSHAGHADLGPTLPLWSCIPFAGMLLSIALWPLIAPEFWHIISAKSPAVGP